MSAKVHYYQATGRANAIRLALAAADIPFEDIYPSGGYPVSSKAATQAQHIRTYAAL